MKENQNKNRKTVSEKLWMKAPTNWSIILPTVFLVVYGLIMIYSASYYYAESNTGYTPYQFFQKQLICAIGGFVGLFILSHIRLRFLANKKTALIFEWGTLIASVLVIIAVRIPGIGVSSHGAYRWIKIGIQFQVAELVKVGMILYFALFLNRIQPRNLTRKEYLIRFSFIFAIALLLLVLSDNLSTAIIVALMGYFTLMIYETRPKPSLNFKIALGAGVLLAVLIVVIIALTPYSASENFRITRIRAWLNPTDPNFIIGTAYQPTQARYAIVSGGFFGKGLGQSLIKFKLPEPHNDYILAILFEELGIFGFVLLTILFGYLLYRIYRVYQRTLSILKRYIVLGVFLQIGIQTIFNYFVTIGLFPTTGITLPFISYGGTSVSILLLEIGLVLSVDRENTELDNLKQVKNEKVGHDPYYQLSAKVGTKNEKRH